MLTESMHTKMSDTTPFGAHATLYWTTSAFITQLSANSASLITILAAPAPYSNPQYELLDPFS